MIIKSKIFLEDISVWPNMGADAKRKEARKRRFGTDTAQDSIKVEAGPSANEQAVTQPPKKKGKTEQDPQISPIPNKSTVKDDGIATDGNDLDGKLEEDAPEKSNRFILFIGELPIHKLGYILLTNPMNR